MWGLSPWVIILKSAFSRIIAAWSCAPAPLLALQPCKQMAGGEGQESRSKPQQQARPAPLPQAHPQPWQGAPLMAGPHCCPNPGTLHPLSR